MPMSPADWGRLVALSVLWGGSFLFVELALQGLPPVTVVWGRVAVAALILAVVMYLGGLPWPKGRQAWGALSVMAVLNNVVPYTAFAVAQGQITGSLAAILNASTPLFTVILAHALTPDERLSVPKALGVVGGFVGVAVLMGGGAGGAAGAMALCLGAALSYALAGLWGRRFRRHGVAPMQAAFGQVAASSVLLLPVWLWHDQPWALSAPGAGPLLAVVGIASLSTALAYVVYFRLLASAGATNLLLVTFLIPVSATALGIWALGESVAWRHVAGFALIALGLAAIDGRLLRAARPESLR